jgi:hypothetical protein
MMIEICEIHVLRQIPAAIIMMAYSKEGKTFRIMTVGEAHSHS